MTNSNSARDLRGSGNAGLTTKRRQRGTSLVEILVVIVIFLIGILAVVQVFPRGFKLLLTTRNNSVATALGREAVERLKGSPELIPDQVVPVVYVNGLPVVDPTVNPLALTPQGDSLDSSGVLMRGGQPAAGDWKLASGPNVARRVLGEGHRIPADRRIRATASEDRTAFEGYGGLLVLDHNPIDPGPVNDPAYPHIVAYGNELSRTEGAPIETAAKTPPAATNYTVSGASVQVMSADGSTVVAALDSAVAATTASLIAPYEFFTVNSGTPTAGILLPALKTADRTYRIRLSAYVSDGGGGAQRVDYTALSIRVPRVANATGTPDLVLIPIADVLVKYGLIPNATSLFSVEAESIRVAPQYRRVTTWTTYVDQNLSTGPLSNSPPIDPFEMKVVDANLGVLLFSPAARNGVVSRPGGVSEPLLARVDYDVLDWRVIGEEFRLVKNDATVQLSLQSLKVGGNLGPDGLVNGGIFNGALQGSNGNAGPWDPSISPNVPASPRDNLMVIDLTTGCEVQKYRTDATATINTGASTTQVRTLADDPTGTASGSILVGVDKSRGSITFHDADLSTSDVDVRLLVPGHDPVVVSSANRTFRVLYRARQEWAVQTLKGASQYTMINSLPSGTSLPDVAYVDVKPGGNGTRIYFAPSQVNTKVTIDRIAYRDGNGDHILEGQDFTIQAPTPTDTTSLPYVDITQVVGMGAQFSPPALYGNAPVQGIKGASVSVRVLWNPDVLTLTNDTATNFARIDQYNRGWRKSTSQTYLRAEETR